MKHYLFLDDDAKRHLAFARWCVGVATVDHVHTAAEAVAALGAGDPYDAAFLDHDLGGRTFVPAAEAARGHGPEVAAFLAALPEARRPRYVVCHSHSPAGARAMAATLEAAGVAVVEVVPFYQLEWHGWKALTRMPDPA